jgi:hypothetical protein
MKKLFIVSLAILTFLSFLIISEAQKKEAVKQKDSPCVIDCNNEHKKCIDASKKVKKTERKGKLAECDKLQKDCKANCDKVK